MEDIGNPLTVFFNMYVFILEVFIIIIFLTLVNLVEIKPTALNV